MKETNKEKVDKIIKTNGYIKFRDFIDVPPGGIETQEVLRIDDCKGREYMWDGTELYRLKPLKRKLTSPELTK